MKFLVGVVLVGILIHLAGTYLSDTYPFGGKLLVQFVFLALVAGAVLFVVITAISHLTTGRFAVEAFILNGQDELLLYRHPHHKCMLPPGGRVKRSELPHLAIHERLSERLGLSKTQYGFDPLFHHGLTANTGNLGEVERVAAPFLVQRELRKQRSFIKFHYDFIYVLRLTDESANFEGVKCAPVHFAGLAALEAMVAERRTFPDVLDAYKRVLAIAQPTSPA